MANPISFISKNKGKFLNSKFSRIFKYILDEKTDPSGFVSPYFNSINGGK